MQDKEVVELYIDLINEYKAYSKLLSDELNSVVHYAYSHGWRSSRYEEGKVSRERIEKLMKEIEKIKGEEELEDLYYK